MGWQCDRCRRTTEGAWHAPSSGSDLCTNCRPAPTMEETAAAFGVTVSGDTAVLSRTLNEDFRAGDRLHYCTSSPYSMREYYDGRMMLDSQICNLCRSSDRGQVWHKPGAGRDRRLGKDICSKCLPPPSAWRGLVLIPTTSPRVGGAAAGAAPIVRAETTVSYQVRGTSSQAQAAYDRLAPFAVGSSVPRGTLVARGPGWKDTYDGQDGTAGAPGWVTEAVDSVKPGMWIKVAWHGKDHRNSYKGAADRPEIVPIRLHPCSAAASLCRHAGVDVPVAAPAAAGAGVGAHVTPETVADALRREGGSSGALVARTIEGMRTMLRETAESLRTVAAEKEELQRDLGAAQAARVAEMEQRARAETRAAEAMTRARRLEVRLVAMAEAGAELREAAEAAGDALPEGSGPGAAAAAPGVGGGPSLARQASTRTQALGVCCVCMERPSCMCPAGCGHVCLCEECAAMPGLRECPMCRVRITGKVRVYLCGGD